MSGRAIDLVQLTSLIGIAQNALRKVELLSAKQHAW